MSQAGPYSIGSDMLPGMSKLIEEMGELSQVLGKLIATGGKAGHWDGTDLRGRLKEELADVAAAAWFFATTNKLDDHEYHMRRVHKQELFQRWHAEQGMPKEG
jgi:NTP pyrophosphatase (non-canonical NTP hydrolase)